MVILELYTNICNLKLIILKRKGLLAQIVPEKGDAYAVPIRTMMLLGAGLMAVHGSELLDYEGAGPLAVVFAAFTSNYFW
jgi:solute carrier family 9B (sodium/hydrogen exchanger), member 1/2